MFQSMSIFKDCCGDYELIIALMKGLYVLICFVLLIVCLSLSIYNFIESHIKNTKKDKIEGFKYFIIGIIIFISSLISRYLVDLRYPINEHWKSCWCIDDGPLFETEDIIPLFLTLLLYVLPIVLFIVGTFKVVLNYGVKTEKAKIKFKRGLRFCIYSVILFAIALFVIGLL